MIKLILSLALCCACLLVSGQNIGYKLSTPRQKAAKIHRQLTDQELKEQFPQYKESDTANMQNLNTKVKEAKAKGKTEEITLNKIDLEDRKKIMLDRQKKRIAKLNELYKAATDVTVVESQRSTTFRAIRDNGFKDVNALEAELTKLKFTIDSLNIEYQKEIITSNSLTVFGFKAIKSRAFLDMIYDTKNKRFSSLSSAGINIGDETGSVFTELVSGNMGLFRVSLGSMVATSSAKDDVKAQQEEAYQRLITTGGNTVLDLEYPFAYVHSNDGLYNFITRFQAKGTADFPAFGTTSDKWAGSIVAGADLYMDIATSNNLLRFFGNFNINKIYGTGTYRDNLGIDKTNFTFGQLTLGLVFKETVRLSFIVLTTSSQGKLTNHNVIAGGQVLR